VHALAWWGIALAAIVLAMFDPRFRKWLASMQTAITLLAVLAALSMAGVLIGQNLPLEAYVGKHGPGLGAFIVRSGLSNVFGAWYFLIIVTLLGVSVITCSFVRIARLVRTPSGLRIGKLGSLLTHISIVVVLVGGLVTALTGFRVPAERFLSAGDAIVVPEGGYSLRVDAARTEFNDRGMLSEYVSEVTVIEDGRDLLSQRIEVNHPLVHNGVGVYQFEMLPSATSIESTVLGVFVTTPHGERGPFDVVAAFGEEVEVPNTAYSVKVLEFLAHFTYDIESRTAALASVWHDNPAVLVQLSEDGEVLGEQWVFAAFPAHDDGGLPCRFVLLDYRPDFEHALTRFEFARQPGTPLLFGGFIAMSLGLCLTFWTRRPAGAADGGQKSGRAGRSKT